MSDVEQLRRSRLMQLREALVVWSGQHSAEWDLAAAAEAAGPAISKVFLTAKAGGSAQPLT